MRRSAKIDMTNGYEEIAEEYIRVRSVSGRAIVRNWALRLPVGADVIDIGAGFGEPITSVLVDIGLRVRAIDASRTMVQEFRRRLPNVEIACEPLQTSDLFGLSYDAALAVGFIFLFPAAEQRRLIFRVAGHLKPGASFLFTAPKQACTWVDVLSGRKSISLGTEAYNDLLIDAGMTPMAECVDESGTDFLEAIKN